MIVQTVCRECDVMAFYKIKDGQKQFTFKCLACGTKQTKYWRKKNEKY